MTLKDTFKKKTNTMTSLQCPPSRQKAPSPVIGAEYFPLRCELRTCIVPGMGKRNLNNALKKQRKKQFYSPDPVPSV